MQNVFYFYILFKLNRMLIWSKSTFLSTPKVVEYSFLHEFVTHIARGIHFVHNLFCMEVIGLCNIFETHLVIIFLASWNYMGTWSIYQLKSFSGSPYISISGSLYARTLTKMLARNLGETFKYRNSGQFSFIHLPILIKSTSRKLWIYSCNQVVIHISHENSLMHSSKILAKVSSHRQADNKSQSKRYLIKLQWSISSMMYPSEYLLILDRFPAKKIISPSWILPGCKIRNISDIFSFIACSIRHFLV